MLRAVNTIGLLSMKGKGRAGGKVAPNEGSSAQVTPRHLWAAVTSGDRMDGKAMVSENSTQQITTNSGRGPMWRKRAVSLKRAILIHGLHAPSW